MVWQCLSQKGGICKRNSSNSLTYSIHPISGMININRTKITLPLESKATILEIVQNIWGKFVHLHYKEAAWFYLIVMIILEHIRYHALETVKMKLEQTLCLSPCVYQNNANHLFVLFFFKERSKINIRWMFFYINMDLLNPCSKKSMNEIVMWTCAFSIMFCKNLQI